MVITTAELRERYGLSRTEVKMFTQREFESLAAADVAITCFKSSPEYLAHLTQRVKATPGKAKGC
jgi:hypothetical protein